jgi:programmed cell death protein 4
VFETNIVEPTDERVCSGVDYNLREYFNNADVDNLLEDIVKIGTQQKRTLIIERFIESGLEVKKEFRELISKAIQHFILADYLTEYDVANGFANILFQSEELMLDTPDIVNILGKFIARADFDNCLPPKFIEIELKNSETKLIYDIMIMAHGFRKNNAVRTCWGETGGFVETKLLSEKIREILKEFLSTQDSNEVARCLRDLDVPHFHHEIGMFITYCIL